MKKCIVCEKILEKEKTIEKYDVYFCADKCVIVYEEKLAKLDESMDWDKCC